MRGGAELTTTPFGTALAAEHAEQLDDKVAIARRVANELPEDGIVLLDSGSLTFVCGSVTCTRMSSARQRSHNRRPICP